jgi:hypothetical protein
MTEAIVDPAKRIAELEGDVTGLREELANLRKAAREMLLSIAWTMSSQQKARSELIEVLERKSKW